MMMNTPKCLLRTATIAVLCAAATGCTTSELPDGHLNPAPDGKVDNLITITAAASGDKAPQTRVAYDDDAVDTGGDKTLTWEDGDKLSVLAKGTGGSFITDVDAPKVNEFTMEAGAGETTATFTGSKIDGAERYFVYTNPIKTNGSVTYISLLKQSAAAGAAADAAAGDYIVLAAEGTGGTGLTEDELNTGINFEMKTAIMKFQLTGLPADLTKITSLTWSINRTDAFTDYVIDGALQPANKSNAIELTFTNGEGQSITGNTLTAYISFLPFTLAKDEAFRVTLKGEDMGGNTVAYYQEVTITATGGVAYEAGSRYTAEMGNSTTTGGWKSIIFNRSTVAEDFTTGDGVGDSADNPYIISTPGHLKYLAEQVNDKGNSFANKFIRLDTDIEVAAWEPIGTSYTTPFSGSFDGNHHTISGELKGNAEYFGFFGYCGQSGTSCTISNLNMTATVTLNIVSTGQGCVGSVAGRSYSKITGCTNTGTVTGPERADNSNIFIGGIVGNGATVENCTNYGAIYPGQGGINTVYAGGIIGSCGESSLSGCTNYGTVEATKSSYGYYAGGIVGNGNLTNLDGCTNFGQVNGGEAGSVESATGGIIGYLLGNAYSGNGHLHRCHNKGEVQAGTSNGGTAYTGGLAGYLNDAKVYNCCTTTTLSDKPIGGAQAPNTTDLTVCDSGHTSGN